MSARFDDAAAAAAAAAAARRFPLRSGQSDPWPSCRVLLLFFSQSVDRKNMLCRRCGKAG